MILIRKTILSLTATKGKNTHQNTRVSSQFSRRVKRIQCVMKFNTETLQVLKFSKPIVLGTGKLLLLRQITSQQVNEQQLLWRTSASLTQECIKLDSPSMQSPARWPKASRLTFKADLMKQVKILPDRSGSEHLPQQLCHILHVAWSLL